jgi:hypothetical protein
MRTLVVPGFTIDLNARMAAAVRRARVVPGQPLPTPLADIVRGGWTTTTDGALIWRRFESSGRAVDVAVLGDLTGVEAFINHVHLDDLLPDWRRGELLQAAFDFAVQGIRTAETSHGRSCTAIVTAGRSVDGVTVRIHSSRQGESWVDADLGSYRDEAIAVLRAEEP